MFLGKWSDVIQAPKTLQTWRIMLIKLQINSLLASLWSGSCRLNQKLAFLAGSNNPLHSNSLSCVKLALNHRFTPLFWQSRELNGTTLNIEFMQKQFFTISLNYYYWIFVPRRGKISGTDRYYHTVNFVLFNKKYRPKASTHTVSGLTNWPT